MLPLDDQLLDLLETWETAKSAGKSISVETLSQGDPELANRLKAAIEQLDQAAWMDHGLLPEELESSAASFSSSAPKTLPGAPENGRIGPYELLELLGQGGMGSVFKARHTRLGKLVAVKLLSEKLTRNSTAVKRFCREMKAVGVLEHPNIVRAMDADEQNGLHYLVMEYIDGKDLQQMVQQQGPFSVLEACRITAEAAKALEHAHHNGLIHRDIKPANFLLSKTGQLKLLDLGLARLTGEFGTESGITHSGTSLGTPDYMAPEQWSDSRTVDHRTDLYSLGCTLYFLLVGHAPFATKEYRNVVAKMNAHSQGAIPNLLDKRNDIPSELQHLFQDLLAKTADKRVQTATEVFDRLQTIASPTSPKKNLRSLPNTSPKAPPASFLRHRLTLIIAAISVVTFIAIAYYVLNRVD